MGRISLGLGRQPTEGSRIPYSLTVPNLFLKTRNSWGAHLSVGSVQEISVDPLTFSDSGEPPFL